MTQYRNPYRFSIKPMSLDKQKAVNHAIKEHLDEWADKNKTDWKIDALLRCPAFRGKELSLRESNFYGCLVQASGWDLISCMHTAVKHVTVHDQLNKNGKPCKPDAHILARIAHAYRPDGHFFKSSWMTPLDLCNLYNSVYKVTNLAHWSVKNAVTALLNEDIDNQNMPSDYLLQLVICKMSSKLSITTEAVADLLTIGDIKKMDVTRYVRFVGQVRTKRASAKLNIQNESVGGIRDRFNNALKIVESIQPKNWETHLQGLPAVIARKRYPQGSLVAIELEFGCKANAALLSMDSDDYPDMPFVIWKGDGSVGSANGDGMHVANYQEVNVMLNPDIPSDVERLEKVVKWLVDNGAMVNSTCGMHIHIDTRHITDGVYRGKVTKFIDCHREWMKYVVNHSRATGTYCSVTARPGNRYCSVNSTARTKFRTLEIRIGHGTLNIHKIKAWIALNRWMFNTPPKNVKSFEAFMASNCPHIVKAYVMGRMFKFAKSWADSGDVKPLAIKELVEQTSDVWAV